MSLSVASIHVYPIKSLGGFTVQEGRLTDRGLEHDRRWMLIDGGGRFVSQRELPAMACLHCTPLPNGFRITDVRDGDALHMPWRTSHGTERSASVWDDVVTVISAPSELSNWIRGKLDNDLTLVYMPDQSTRPTDVRYADAATSLSDGFPYLIISQASLDDLNARIDTAARVPMDRFRPNIVVAGGTAFQEDDWRSITIGQARFQLVKPCARCPIPTTDQRTGERGKEPLRTLATYRRRGVGEGVFFGMNAIADGEGSVRTGDLVTT